ncbi:Zn-dependent oligopeptidase [Candidatus Parcubacteria bacterium]|nr:Zn-dependent oligopeptidase [Candidatus Parcubacteria bacterium]
MKIIPKIQKDFEWVAWGPKEIDVEVKKYVETLKENYKKIKEIPKKERTFENTIYAMEKAGDVGYENNGISFLKYVSTSKKIREASHQAVIWASSQLAEINNDLDLYRAFKEYNPRKENLTDEEKRLYKNTKIWFENKGFHLSEEERKEMVKISQRTSKLESEFSKNIDSYEDHILCTKEELSGLPDNYISNLKKDKKTKKYIVSLDYPELVPFMTFSESEKKRKELAVKNGKKGGKKNLKILQELLILRKKKAEILGYKSYSEMVVKHRVSKNPENIKNFLEETLKDLKPRVKKDTIALQKFAKKELGLKELTFFNTAYASNKMKKSLFDYDPNITKEYFPLDKVMEYMFQLFGGLFGVSFKKNNLQLWHKDVLSYDVIEKGKPVAHVIFDLFPRPGKFSHMACWNFMAGEDEKFRSKNYKAPVSVIVGNFPRGTKKNPSLLSVGEVRTLFHEFGHMSHDFLTRAHYAAFAGTGTDEDFVETPSQMFENWTKDIDILVDMSSHYKTGEKLPVDIQEKIKSMKTFMKAGEHYGTFVYGVEDLLMHTTHYNKDLRKLSEMIDKKYSMVKPNKQSLHPAGWGHMTGYAASYYTYVWSLVYAYDLFSRFKKEGVRSKKAGKDLRDKILSKGGSEDEIGQMKAFLGRKPNNKAFLEALGVK